MKTVYETERLLLKVVDKSYSEMVLDYYLRNKSFLEPWEPVRNEEFYTKKYHEEQLDKELTEIKNNNSFTLWVFKKELKLYLMSMGCTELKLILCQKTKCL